jgi:hypothetical protein
MKKVLEIAVDKIDLKNGIVRLHISNQSHRGNQFGKSDTDSFFTATNQIKIECRTFPAFYENNSGELYVRGYSTADDNTRFGVPFSYFTKVLEAIKEYNEFEFPEEKHEIVIDGKTVEISKESFEALKKSLIK